MRKIRTFFSKHITIPIAITLITAMGSVWVWATDTPVPRPLTTTFDLPKIQQRSADLEAYVKQVEQSMEAERTALEKAVYYEQAKRLEKEEREIRREMYQIESRGEQVPDFYHGTLNDIVMDLQKARNKLD
jgi:predicted solute-binding protein